MLQSYFTICYRYVVNRLMQQLPEYDITPISDDTEGRTPPVIIMSLIDHCTAQLLSIVGGARIGVDKPLHLTPNSEEMCCVRGYLLAWRLLLKYLQYTTNEVCYVLYNLSRLIPTHYDPLFTAYIFLGTVV